MNEVFVQVRMKNIRVGMSPKNRKVVLFCYLSSLQIATGDSVMKAYMSIFQLFSSVKETADTKNQRNNNMQRMVLHNDIWWNFDISAMEMINSTLKCFYNR